MPRSSVEDPLKNSNFVVEVDGFARAGFAEVTGLSRKTEVIEYREGGDPAHPRLSAGTSKFDPVVLKRGILSPENMGAYDFIDFLRDVHNVKAKNVQARDYRRDFDIVVPKRDNSTGARYRFYNAWPSEYKASDLNAKNNETWMEEVTISHEGWDRIF